MQRKRFFEIPEMILIRLGNQEDVIRTSQVPDENDDNQWTGFYQAKSCEEKNI